MKGKLNMFHPDELKYTKDHAWVLIEDDTVKIGITDFAQDQLGDILFVDLPEVGDTFEARETFTEVESAKTASEVPCPVSGEVIAVNEDLDEDPELINEDPYANWIIQLALEDESELYELLSADEYEALIE